MSLYRNIAAKKKRIKAGSGETMKKAGMKGRPTANAFKQAAKTAKPVTKRLRNNERREALFKEWH